MASKKFFSILVPRLLLLLLVLGQANAKGLKRGFYRETCPSVEAIVRKTTARFVRGAPTLAAPLLRLHFHDCFVGGCDGSVLLNSTNDNQAERDAVPNQTLRGFQVIDVIKSALEEECPGVVSCADILALVARDAVSSIGGPFWKVPLGRRDGSVSKQSEASANLPPPFGNITQLKQIFAANGLSVKDLAVLSGAHTIGTGHCFEINDRLYNFTGNGDADPSLDSEYLPRLKNKCKPGDRSTLLEMDPGSFKTFDAHYYSLVSKRRGLFQSDAALLQDDETRAYVRRQAASQGSTFFKDFGKSMVKMGRNGVLTGGAGEIRRRCAFVN